MDVREERARSEVAAESELDGRESELDGLESELDGLESEPDAGLGYESIRGGVETSRAKDA
ncbi:hypothetical protein FRC11_009519, partial [Ceratobasidium sp. 423]